MTGVSGARGEWPSPSCDCSKRVFGYVRPASNRLTAEENERFRSAYCGLCHSIGKRYGFTARFLLSYDFTLLAILLSGGEDPRRGCKRCVAHPCKGCTVMEGTEALDAAADRSVVLFWWQLRDHIADHGFFGGLRYRLAALLYRGAYEKARRRVPDFDETVRERLAELSRRERERCASLDEAAEPFASLLSALSDAESDPVRRRVLAQLFYHLGRWIYLVDAADDFADDAKSGNYNPLRYRYALEGDTLGEAEKQAVAATLDRSIERMASAYALLDSGVWTPVLDSIFYDSLYGIGKAVLDGVYHKPPRRAFGRGAEGEMI